jgi:hypothetical protein
VTAPVMERPTGRHPLAADLERLRGMSDYLDAELRRPPGGWISLRRLIEDRRLLDDALKRNALAYKGTRRIAANFVAGGVTWATAGVPLALMVIERRAIALDPDLTFLRIDERGEVKGAFYDDPEFCVLPGDPAASHEQAVLVDDVSAMHERIRTRLIGSLEPLVEVLSDLAGLSRRSLWGQIASSWGSAIIWAAQLAGRGSAGIAEAEAFLRGSGPAFGDPPIFYRIQHRGQELVAMRRGVCCLAYKLSDYPYCGSCPLISDDERHQRYCAEADGEESSPHASQASPDTDQHEDERL